MNKPTNKESLPLLKKELKMHWWHWGLFFLMGVILTLLTPGGGSPEFTLLSEGSISHDKIIAPFDFEVLKFPEELKSERDEAAANVLPVVVKIDSLGDTQRREIMALSDETHRMFANFSKEFYAAFLDTTLEITSVDSILYRRGHDEIFDRFGFRLGENAWQFLINLFIYDRKNSPGAYFLYFENVMEGILRDLYGKGILNVDKDDLDHPTGKITIQYEAEEDIVELDKLYSIDEAAIYTSELLPSRLSDEYYPSGAISTSYAILQPFVAPNIIFAGEETDSRKEAAIAKVPLAKGLVKKDELIIDSNIRVNKDHVAKLRSLSVKRQEMEVDQSGIRVLLSPLGYFLIIGMLTSLFWIFIAIVRPKVWSNWKLVLLIVIIFGMIHSFQYFVPIKLGWSVFAFPAAVLAMLIGILIDRITALASVVLMSMIAGLLQGYDFFAALCALAVGMIAVFSLRHVSTRGDVMRATAYLAIIYIPLVTALQFISYSVSTQPWMDYVIAFSNSILSPILVLGLVYIFELVFRISTDLSLLELVDLNRPLLRELAIKSPGTYHHSLMVGSLAEAAARSIGANSLLTRAGALYHDIGKMKNKSYFIENQEAGSENIHDSLPPTKSAEILIDHVNYGLTLAKKYRLPAQIQDFISQHHAKSRLKYFYAKAVDEIGSGVNEDLFLYPGPKPQTKETAILMLADLVEAATRTIRTASTAEIELVVADLVRERTLSGDLDESPLTFLEINIINSSFVRVLTGIHHQRIPYPNQNISVTDGDHERDQNSFSMSRKTEIDE